MTSGNIKNFELKLGRTGLVVVIAGMAALMREKGLRPAGILAEGLVENGVRSGFDLVDLSTGARVPLCRRGAASSVKAGEFGFFAEGLAAGEKALSAESLRGADAVFVDEVGFLELEGGGWAPALERLLKKSRVPLILSVRDELSAPVSSRWGIAPAAVLQAGTSPAAAVPRILPR